MSLFAICAGKGRPGVTTTAVALNAVWSPPKRVVVAGFDVAGDDLAPRFNLASTPGVLTLASAARRGLSDDDVAHNAQIILGGIEVLVGPSLPEQAQALSAMWSPLAGALANLAGTDVVADCGRLGAGSAIGMVMLHAAVTLVVVRPTKEGLAHTEAALPALNGSPAEVALVVVGEARAANQVEVALRLPVAGVVADDPRAAAILEGQPGKLSYLRRSLLIRSARALAANLGALGAPDEEDLDVELGRAAEAYWPSSNGRVAVAADHDGSADHG